MAKAGGGRSDWERQQRAIARDAERERREAERKRIAAEKERKRQYVETRTAEVEELNRSLEEAVTGLNELLSRKLHRSARIDLAAQRVVPDVAPLDLGKDAVPVPVPAWERYAPKPPGALSRVLGGAGRYERALNAAKADHERAVLDAEQQEIERQRRVVSAREKHAAQVSRAEAGARKHNEAIDAQARGVAKRVREDVESYFRQVLRRVPLPEGFPNEAEVTFNPRAEQVIVQVALPTRDVVPVVAGHKYLSTKDEVRTIARPKAEVAALYRRVVSQVALLCVRDLFNSDARLKGAGFNGHVRAINPATGEQEYPCIISLNVERDDFLPDDNLSKVTPEACVRHLKAIVSNHPYELEPIEPILDFDLSKYSFVEGFDAVATLDSRPDLMDMSPTNFEHLVRQIFEAQGAEGWTTTESKDDGVDAVIVQRKALMGGLSIVQAKRYSRVVGVNHIRELAGTMEEKKAGWGILVTTSNFTAGCWAKAKEHGRMELIDGSRLVHLIKKHLDKDVLIGIENHRKRQTKK
jgi:restriction system protein